MREFGSRVLRVRGLETPLSMSERLVPPGTGLRRLLYWLPVLCCGSVAQAQEGSGAATSRATPMAQATARVAAIRVDGRLEDAEWGAVPVASGFVQRQPLEGRPAVHQTEVRVAYDDQAIYVAARLYDPEPQTIARQVVRRDEEGQFDYFAVEFDPNLDRRTGYRFRVSASNVQRDEYLFDDNERDAAWDAVWESAVQIDSLGWTVEIRIPLSQLRYRASRDPQAWGVNFFRRRLRSNEESHFALISQLQRGHVSQYGLLSGMQILRAPRRIEIRPYALSNLTREATQVGPYATGANLGWRGGVDVRYGLGSQFTLDATINPDFGQVEADPAVINLSAFETFFEERRPFFVEDAKIFDFTLSGGRNRVFYSRRIGRSPQGAAPSGASYVDAPDAATILGAVKLTGRTNSGLSVGALAAVTRGEYGRAYVDGGSVRYLAEPRTLFGVTRLKQDYNGGASTVGAIATVLSRALPEDGSFDHLPDLALGGGFDWEHQWSDRTWAFFGYLAGSYVQGDSVAMIRLQRSSVHYFQRPDALRLRVDSTARRMAGYDWRMTLEKRRGDHWTGSVWLAQVSPGFEINDLGFSSRQEVLDGGARISYREIRPGRYLRSYGVTFSTFHNYSHDLLENIGSAESWARSHVSGSFSLNGNFQFLNYWRLEANLSLEPERMDRTATRGGPLMRRPRSVNGRLGLDSDPRKVVTVSPNVSFERSAEGDDQRFGVNLDVGVRPSALLSVSFSPAWSYNFTGAQYVATTSVLPYAPTFGRRYLFGELHRRELSLSTRINAAFSPTLSFQLYVQPLLSAGDFTVYKQLLEPASFSFDKFAEGTYAAAGGAPGCSGGRTCSDASGRRYIDFDGDGVSDYSFSERDFNVRSLRGNAVLRWEYRPGSTLFLVWQRRQVDEVGIGDFDFRRDAAAMLRAPFENVFMVKARYRIGL